MAEEKLTAKQALFVQEYLVDLNATQAAIRAGYSEKTAPVIGCQNLTKLNIAEAVALAFAERSERTEITQDKVLAELALIGFATLPEGDEIRVSDKLGALDKLCRHLGMFTEHHHHSGEIVTKARQMSDEELLERSAKLANRIGTRMSANGGRPSTNGDS